MTDSMVRSDDRPRPVAPEPAGSDHRRYGFVLEQTLGHVTHADNLRSIISADPTVDAVWLPIDWQVDGIAAHLPVYATNWTVRAGLRARRAIGRVQRTAPVDALFVHTQVPSVLAGPWLRRVPTVVSVDATPLQYDALGDVYAHDRAGERLERLKWRLNQRAFQRAAHLVSWSAWAKAGLVDGYGVAPEAVSVIPPGVHAAQWAVPPRRAGSSPLRILFVGGDLERKGGSHLIEAFRHLRSRRPADDLELHLVTRTPVPPEPGVTVHHGLQPNSRELRALYASADVFCLPTLGDCLPMVLSEAGAAGLPLVSTAVGAIDEIVRDGDTGLLVRPGDVRALTGALARLVDDPPLRRHMGARAAEVVRQDYDAVTNARRLLDVMSDVAGPVARRVLLTVSGDIPHHVAEQANHGRRPRPDYLVMADAFDADLIDRRRARAEAGRLGGAIERVAGPNALLAWSCFRLRDRYRVVFTDGEQVGLPYAALTRLAGKRHGRPRHLMIVHIMSKAKKALPFRVLGLRREIDTMIVYATAQRRFLEHTLGVEPERVTLTPFMVDTDFFTPTGADDDEPVICAAGLEGRDYATLVEAVRGLDVRVVLAAASPWAKQGRPTDALDIPDNVEVCSLDFVDLRRLYARSRFVVMPLHETMFQAGVTTLLEAMAMGKAVICSRTSGQTDVVVDGVTGLYVAPGDPADLRRAITTLLADPSRAQRMGAAGRRRVERDMDVEVYAERLARLLPPTAPTGP